MLSSSQKGVTLIEVIVAVSIVAGIVISVGFSITTFVNARAQLLAGVQQLYLAEEGYEIIRALRDTDWSTIDTLTNGTRYHLDVATTTLAVGGSSEMIDGTFYRSFLVQSVARDSDDDIVSSTTPGSTVDPEAREVHVSVSGPAGTTTITVILTNINAI